VCRQSRVLMEVASSTGAALEDVTSYFSQRSQEEREAKRLGKFTEASWRDLIYTAAVVVGFWVLQTCPWASNIRECWCVRVPT
jgi:hypothetical protein